MAQLTKTLWIPLLIAVVAALASVLGPFVLDKITKSIALTYTHTAGPTIYSDGLNKRIHLVTIANSGTEPLTDVTTRITNKAGTIEQFQFSDNFNLGLTEQRNSPDSFELAAERLLKNEEFGVALMTTSSSIDDIDIVVRSHDSIGLPSSPEVPEDDSFSLIVSASAAAAAFVLSLIFGVLIGVARGISPKKDRPSRREKLVYASEYFKLYEWKDIFVSHWSELSYRITSSIIFVRHGEDSTRRVDLAANLAFFYVSTDVNSSRAAIAANLAAVAGISDQAHKEILRLAEEQSNSTERLETLGPKLKEAISAILAPI